MTICKLCFQIKENTFVISFTVHLIMFSYKIVSHYMKIKFNTAKIKLTTVLFFRSYYGSISIHGF